jgi:large subunit ribosomal protein L10
MSKPVKEMMQRQMTRRLEGVTSVAVVDLTGVDANDNNRLRSRLREKDISLHVVKNSLARQAFKEVGLEQACDLLEGPCALAYGADSVVVIVRELRDIAKEVANLGVKGALLEGDVFGAERMEELSKYPTREEAIGQITQAATSAGSQLASCFVAPGGSIAALLEAIEQKSGGDDAGDSGEAVAETPAEEAPAEESPASEAPPEGDDETKNE